LNTVWLRLPWYTRCVATLVLTSHTTRARSTTGELPQTPLNVTRYNYVCWNQPNCIDTMHMPWQRWLIRPSDVSREGLKFYPWTFFFCQSTVLSSHAKDGHQMYFGGSIKGKASTIGIAISPIPPLIFTGEKVRNLALFTTSLNLSHPHLKCSKISEFWNNTAMLRWSPYVLT